MQFLGAEWNVSLSLSLSIHPSIHPSLSLSFSLSPSLLAARPAVGSARVFTATMPLLFMKIPACYTLLAERPAGGSTDGAWCIFGAPDATHSP